MSLPHASSRRRLGARKALSTVVVLAATLTGCSAMGDSRDDDRRGRIGSSAGAGGAVVVETAVARVHGTLPVAQRRRLETQAGRLIGRYLSAAYLGQRSTPGHRGAFPGFTPDARRLALRDVSTASDAALTWADEVRPLGAVAFLSVVALEGRAVGATARLLLRMAASDDRREREVAVRGRLLMTPVGKGWQVFGYDLSVSSAPMGKAR